MIVIYWFALIRIIMLWWRVMAMTVVSIPLAFSRHYHLYKYEFICFNLLSFSPDDITYKVKAPRTLVVFQTLFLRMRSHVSLFRE